MTRLNADALFAEAGIAINGPVSWKTPIQQKASGIYVITLLDPDEAFPSALNDIERAHWNEGQEIIYIGRSINLHRRLLQFYRHTYGKRRPHRGGQSILLLGAAMNVYWGVAEDYAAAEKRMIDVFHHQVGKLPFANRMRAARQKKPAPSSDNLTAASSSPPRPAHPQNPE